MANPLQRILPRETVPQAALRRWARLAVNVRIGARRGAWYHVLSAGPEEAVLEVYHRAVIIPRAAIELRDDAPLMWSLVPRAWGGPYLVCPGCAERVRPNGAVGRLHCRRCRHSYPIEQLEENAS